MTSLQGQTGPLPEPERMTENEGVTGRRDFERAAATWDANRRRHFLTGEVAAAMFRHGRVEPDMDALDFGCGTGLLTLQLQPRLRSITGADSSPGMLAELRRKIEEQRLDNVQTQLCDTERGETIAGRYDLVTSSMTLHHVRALEPLFAQFHTILRPGGLVCLADLDTEDGRFHGDNTGVHHFGFDRTALGRMLTRAGFAGVSAHDAARIPKTDASGQPMLFGVFVLVGHKPL